MKSHLLKPLNFCFTIADIRKYVPIFLASGGMLAVAPKQKKEEVALEMSPE